MTESPAYERKSWNVSDQVLDDTNTPATIAFIGETSFAIGKWIGLIYNEPVGKNNGTVKGVKYFECEDNHGKFVREDKIFSMDGSRRGSLAVSHSGSTTSLHSLAESASGVSLARGDGSNNSLKKPSAIRPSLGGGMRPPSSLPAPGKADTSRLSMPANSLTKLTTPKSSVSSTAQPLTKLATTSSSSDSKIAIKPSQKSAVARPTGVEKSVTGKDLPKVSSNDPLNVMASENIKAAAQPIATPEKPQIFPAKVPERRESVVSDTQPPVQVSSITGNPTPSKPAEPSGDIVRKLHDQEMELKKLHLQVEKLEINKGRMAETHSELQKELESARREAREALEASSADEISDLQLSVEMLTMDKEMAEEKRDQLLGEVEDLKLKLEETVIELQTLQQEVKDGGKGEASANFHVQELQKQNEKLKDGLIKLRDIVTQEKHEKQKLEKEVKVLEDANEDFRKTVQRSQEESERTDETMAELREQVDAALGSEEMVERLTEQNLNMEDRLRELVQTVDDYEAISSMNNEVIEMSSQEARHLREEVDMARAESNQLKLRVSELQQTVTDSTVTLHKFRDLTRQLQSENSTLRDQLQLQTVSATSPAAPASIDFRLKLQDEKAVAERVKHRIQEISGKILAKKLAYLSLFMPDIYGTNREEAFVQISILPEQIGLKLNLISEEVNQKFDTPLVINQGTLESLTTKRRDEVTYGVALTFFLKIVEVWDREIDYAIRCASPDVFSMLNELESQLQRQDESIQYYVDLLRQSRLDEFTSLEYLETSAGQLLALIDKLARLGCDQRSSMDKLRDIMDVVTSAARVISAVSVGLRIDLKAQGPEVTKWLQDFSQRSDDLLDIARKIKRPLDTDNELRAVILPDHVQRQLLPLVETVQRVANLCYTWYRAVGHQASIQAAETTTLDGNAVKAVLYTENDRGNFYKSTVASPQQSMLNALDVALSGLRQFFKEIEDGEWTRGSLKAPDVPKIHPLRVRADLLKKGLADAEDLKSRIIAKDEEILEIRKSLRSKAEEVSELQLRRSLAAKKEEKAGKTEEERSTKLLALNNELAARLTKVEVDFEKESSHLRSQIELLESEKRQMENKLQQTSKRFLSVDLSPAKQFGKPATSEPQVEGQVGVLRQVIATLRAENAVVKSEQVRRDLELYLPPLPMPKMAKRDARLERINLLKRQRNALEMEKIAVLARTALDLTKPKEERQKLMQERQRLNDQIKLKLNKMEVELAELNGPGRYFFQELDSAGSVPRDIS